MIENGGETFVGESLEQRYPYEERPGSPGGDSMTSSIECDLMIESLQRELDIVRLELEAIVLQQNPRAPSINTGGVEESSDGRNESTHEVKTLINQGTAVNKKRQQTIPTTVSSNTSTTGPSKKEAQLSWEKQQYYINLVSDRERERTKTRKECLLLMEKHINNQLVMLQQKGDRLARKLQLRIARDKAMSLPPRPVRTRSNVSLIPTQPHFYKSNYYKAVVNDYTASKRQQQSPNIKKQHQSTSVHQSTAVHPPTTSAVNRRAKYPVKDCTLIEEDEWTPDPTNSWALTAASPQTHGPEVKKAATCTLIPYPQLKPLESLLGKKNELEEIKLKSHIKRMNRLANTHRQLLHMYELSQQHQRTFIAPDYDTIEEEETLSSVGGSTTPTSRPLSTKSNEKILSLQSVSCSSSPQSPTPPILKSPPTQFLPRISPTPLLSLDEVVRESTSIKESKKLSSLWKNYTKISESQKI